jgi:hypothetical protein
MAGEILAHNFAAHNQSGQPVTGKALLESFNAAMEGRADVEKWIREFMDIDPRLPTMPLVLGRTVRR